MGHENPRSLSIQQQLNLIHSKLEDFVIWQQILDPWLLRTFNMNMKVLIAKAKADQRRNPEECSSSSNNIASKVSSNKSGVANSRKRKIDDHNVKSNAAESFDHTILLSPENVIPAVEDNDGSSDDELNTSNQNQNSHSKKKKLRQKPSMVNNPNRNYQRIPGSRIDRSNSSSNNSEAEFGQGSADYDDAAPGPSIGEQSFQIPIPTKKTRNNTFTAENKLEAIAYSRQTSMTSASKKFGVDGKTMRGWRKQEENLRRQVETGNRDRRRLGGAGRKIQFPNLEKQLKDWVLCENEAGRPTSRSIIIRQAKELHNMGLDNVGESFNASNGWLHKFLTRNGLTTTQAKPKGKRGGSKKETLPSSTNDSVPVVEQNVFPVGGNYNDGLLLYNFS